MSPMPTFNRAAMSLGSTICPSSAGQSPSASSTGISVDGVAFAITMPLELRSSAVTSMFNVTSARTPATPSTCRTWSRFRSPTVMPYIGASSSLAAIA